MITHPDCIEEEEEVVCLVCGVVADTYQLQVVTTPSTPCTLITPTCPFLDTAILPWSIRIILLLFR